jgi:hypothetical protein
VTLAETRRRARLARSQLAVREPAGKAPTEPVARAQPEANTVGPAPGLRDWIGVLAMGVGLFMAIMDVQIVTSSLSQIQGGLSASADEIAWVQTAYLIADVVMVPLSGMMTRLLSTRIVFVVAALGFTGASALCATATSLGQMIFYRAMHGFFGGAITPTRVAGRLHQVPRPAAGDRHCDHLSDSEPLIYLGPDPRRVFDRYFFLALAIFGQHRTRSLGRHGGVGHNRH